MPVGPMTAGAGWSGGYVTDADYVNEYYDAMAPAHLDLAALQRGIEPPDCPEGRFRYCDLGCGNGLTATVVAAANPAAEVHGIDFLPGHVDAARRLVREAGLANARFHELSFAEATGADLPQFDYVAMHGVYSWVSPAARAEIVAFLRRHLAPGGLVYVSYNAMPGRAQVAPLWRLLWETAQIVPGPSAERARSAIAFAGELREAKATAFELNRFLTTKLSELDGLPGAYVSHEYLNDSWHPLYVTEVMAEMAEAKCAFAASAELGQNAPSRLLTEAQRELVGGLPTLALTELVKDYCLNTAFRADVYSRGGRALSQRERVAALSRLAIGLRVGAGEVRYEMQVAARQVGFDTPAVRAAVARLAEGPATLGALSGELGGFDRAHEAVEPLLASGQALPLARLSAEGEAAAPARRLNAALFARAARGRPLNVLASALGAGVSLGTVDMLFHGLAGASGGDGAGLTREAFGAGGNGDGRGEGAGDGAGAGPGDGAARAGGADEIGTLARNALEAFRGAGLQPSRDGAPLAAEEALASIRPMAERYLAETRGTLVNLGIAPSDLRRPPR